MEKVKLGEQQAQALEEIREFLLGDDFAFVCMAAQELASPLWLGRL